jgi:phosphoribosylformylglycinamidine cyclo-ligase
VLGLASSGLHSNGYSLVRKIVFDVARLKVTDAFLETNKTVGEELLTPTRLYVKPIRALMNSELATGVHGLANITGGGLPDNISRILPPGMRVSVKRGSWPEPPVFRWLQKLGNVADEEMSRVFNMGIGFVVIFNASFAKNIIGTLANSGLQAWTIGEVHEGDVGVHIE